MPDEQEYNPLRCVQHEEAVERVSKVIYGNSGEGLILKVGKLQTSMKILIMVNMLFNRFIIVGCWYINPFTINFLLRYKTITNIQETTFHIHFTYPSPHLA